MQRFFSTFPGHWPGVGLLVLRTVVGGAAAVYGAVAVRSAEPDLAVPVLACAALAAGVAVLAGFLTPAASAMAGIATLFLALRVPAGTLPLGATALVPWLVAADAAALVLLGPGALSVDARLFGRREIVVSRDPRPRAEPRT